MKFVSYLAPGFPATLFKLAAEALDADLTLITTSSGPLLGADPFAAGEFDVGWMCSISYADLMHSPSPSIDLGGVAWVPTDPSGNDQPVYFADLVVRRDSPITTFDDLRGVRFACNDEVSLSGLYALRFELDRLDAGSPESFADITFTGGHHSSLDRLIAGEVDAASIDSVVRLSRATSDAHVADLRVIQRLGPWPVQPFVVRADLPEIERRRVQTALIEASQQPEFQSQLHAAGLKALVAVDHAHYQPVLAAMQRLRAQ